MPNDHTAPGSGEGEQQGAASSRPEPSQVEPGKPVSPANAASVSSARDGNDIWGNLPVGPRVLRLAIKELDDADGLCLYEIENEIGYLESVDIILHQVKLMQWRPISTAPTNGTHILGAKAGTSPARIWFEDGRWWMHGCGPNSQNPADLTGIYAPTDWMPLPLPPAPCDGSGEAGETEGLAPKDDSAVDEASSEVEAPANTSPNPSPTREELQAEIERLTRERDEFAALVCAYAAEEAPEAVAILAADRDLHFERANRAEAENTRLREALSFYARGSEHDPGIKGSEAWEQGKNSAGLACRHPSEALIQDQGRVACAALLGAQAAE